MVEAGWGGYGLETTIRRKGMSGGGCPRRQSGDYVGTEGAQMKAFEGTAAAVSYISYEVVGVVEQFTHAAP
jgi:hypothetical protein